MLKNADKNEPIFDFIAKTWYDARVN